MESQAVEGTNPAAERVIKSIEIKNGYFPLPVAMHYYAILGAYGFGHNEECLTWLNEKGLVFAYDGRYSFPFDVVTLFNLGQAKANTIETKKFSKDLTRRNGLFMFRESKMEGSNMMWNGSETFATPDDLPLEISQARSLSLGVNSPDLQPYTIGLQSGKKVICHPLNSPAFARRSQLHSEYYVSKRH
jgi:hypothetical protein